MKLPSPPVTLSPPPLPDTPDFNGAHPGNCHEQLFTLHLRKLSTHNKTTMSHWLMNDIYDIKLLVNSLLPTSWVRCLKITVLGSNGEPHHIAPHGAHMMMLKALMNDDDDEHHDDYSEKIMMKLTFYDSLKNSTIDYVHNSLYLHFHWTLICHITFYYRSVDISYFCQDLEKNLNFLIVWWKFIGEPHQSEYSYGFEPLGPMDDSHVTLLWPASSEINDDEQRNYRWIKVLLPVPHFLYTGKNRYESSLLQRCTYVYCIYYTCVLPCVCVCVCVCVLGFLIPSNRGRKCDTLHSDRGRFENGDDPHPES